MRCRIRERIVATVDREGANQGLSSSLTLVMA